MLVTNRFTGSCPFSCFSDGGMRRGKILGAEAVISATGVAENGKGACSTSAAVGSADPEKTIFLGSAFAIARLKPFRLFLFDRLAIMIVGTTVVEDGAGSGGRSDLVPRGMSFTLDGSAWAARRSYVFLRLLRAFLFCVVALPWPGGTWLTMLLNEHESADSPGDEISANLRTDGFSV